MKRPKMNTASAGIGGAIVVASLLAGGAMASAQTENPTEKSTTTTMQEPSTAEDTSPPWGDGKAPFGPGKFGQPNGAMEGRGFGGRLDGLATDLGLTPEELSEAFESGQTLPEVAEANGIDLDQLFTQRAADAQAHLDEAVVAGDMTQDRADRIAEMITGFANGESPFGMGHFGGTGGAPWGDGPPPWVNNTQES